MEKKLSDLLIKYLIKKKINQFFAISGGASLHLIHSIAENNRAKIIYPQHEQAVSMAADGYFRTHGKLACAIATSGPGATNLITGIASAYYDSVPILVITGQVATFRAKKNTGVRQMGFQETDIIDICKSFTKYSVQIKNPLNILKEFDKAIKISKEGRPGPVLIDIPDDIQRMLINSRKLKGNINFKKVEKKSFPDYSEIVYSKLKTSKRPVFIFGWGIRLSRSEGLIKRLIRKIQIPIVLTWAARDLIEHDKKLLVGGFGTHSGRAANFTVQNADLIISIGSRLDTKATGTPINTFARNAKIIMVDIDSSETNKFKSLGKKIEVSINADANEFINNLIKSQNTINNDNYKNWINKIQGWKKTFGSIDDFSQIKTKSVNPYLFIKKLSTLLPDKKIIFSDTGCALAWMMQAFEFKKSQRFIHAFNNTPMGYGLAASIGASCENNEILLITGDGSIMMSIQELATIQRNKLPVKVILFNNHGHGMVRQTQDMWLGNNYYATSFEGGLPNPNFKDIFKSFNYKYFYLDSNQKIEKIIKNFLNEKDNSILNLEIDFDAKVIPQVKYGRPNEDAEPLLDRDLFKENMIIDPLEISK